MLWPILHYRVDLQEYSRADQSGYMRVNSLFADQLDAIIEEDDVVWVHDYHLMPLARELRARGRVNPIGFFLHIPCAPPDILQTLPQPRGDPRQPRPLRSRRLPDRQRPRQLRPLPDVAGREAGAQPRASTLDGRQTRLGAFPVGIETAVYARLARNVGRSRFVREMVESLDGQKLVLGVDRLDYSKGIIHRLKAFDRFLEVNPEWRSRVTFLQVTPKSRGEITEYAQIENEVTTLIGKINGRFGEAAWTPIRYVNRSYSRTALAGVYRAADVALVTPLRDGMNLVAKEFVAAQDPENPGRADPVAVRRRGGRARRRADRQSP